MRVSRFQSVCCTVSFGNGIRFLCLPITPFLLLCACRSVVMEPDGDRDSLARLSGLIYDSDACVRIVFLI